MTEILDSNVTVAFQCHQFLVGRDRGSFRRELRDIFIIELLCKNVSNRTANHFDITGRTWNDKDLERHDIVRRILSFLCAKLWFDIVENMKHYSTTCSE